MAFEYRGCTNKRNVPIISIAANVVTDHNNMCKNSNTHTRLYTNGIMIYETLKKYLLIFLNLYFNWFRSPQYYLIIVIIQYNICIFLKHFIILCSSCILF